jgi:hypothetical protein
MAMLDCQSDLFAHVFFSSSFFLSEVAFGKKPDINSGWWLGTFFIFP